MTQTMDPMDVLGIEYVAGDRDDLVFRQFLGTGLVDHRGVLGMSSYATMAEVAGGRAFNLSFPPGSATVQARLSLSAPVPARLGSVVQGTGRLLGSTGQTGVTSAELIDDRGAVICAATGRGVLVGRPNGESAASDIGRAAGDAEPAEQPPLPTPLASDLSGREILEGLADGSIVAGPMQRVLGLRVTAIGDDTLELGVTPTPGMANKMGTMHGGIVTSIMAEAASLGAELSARAGGRFQVSDISVSFLRSPAVDQELAVKVQVVKAGRRIVSLNAVLTDAAGTVLIQAVADATAARPVDRAEPTVDRAVNPVDRAEPTVDRAEPTVDRAVKRVDCAAKPVDCPEVICYVDDFSTVDGRFGTVDGTLGTLDGRFGTVDGN